MRMRTEWLTEYDIHLLSEGTHYHSYNKLGAHLVEVDGIPGVQFSVWAPNAKRVSVIGDFNGWNETAHVLKIPGSSGIWSGFVPGVDQGAKYKYHILSNNHGHVSIKADPYAFFSETPPDPLLSFGISEDIPGMMEHGWSNGRKSIK